jgi:hypothetical protein
MPNRPKLLQVNDAVQFRLDNEALGFDGLRVMPAAFYAEFPQNELSGFCLRNGLYALPTTELCDLINRLILEVSPTRSAIEIGSGNGVLGRALGIPCTDNHMQDDPVIQAHYRAMGQPAVNYGKHVLRMSAEQAVKQLKPEVVVGAWVTHKYHPAEHFRGGNVIGVDEGAMLNRIKRYIFVGNSRPHALKPLLAVTHKTIKADYIFSRGFDGTGNMVLVWDNPDFEG